VFTSPRSARSRLRDFGVHVRARSAVDTPAACTWSIYEGPLLIDFEVPFEVDAPEDVTRVVRAKAVTFKRPPSVEGVPLEVREPDDCDTVAEMQKAVLRQAFPKLAEAVYDGGAADIGEVCRATAKDIEAQSKRLARVGVTFGDDAELLRTRMLAFRFKAPRSFERLAVTKANDFCAGLRRVTPDADGLVRLVYVQVTFRRRAAFSAIARAALKLRTDADGTVIMPHRAGAFEGDSDGSRSPMHDRRNDAVTWALSQKEREGLEAAIDERFGQRVPLTFLPN
jgi:hypothetical protein